jgi:YVTN family beta-propeller protein
MLTILSACGPRAVVERHSDTPTSTPAPVADAPTGGSRTSNPGGPINVYQSTISGELEPSVENIPQRVYVPDDMGETVVVIAPKTMAIVNRIKVGRLPEHIAPSPDFTKLYVDNEGDWTISVLDPRSGKIVNTLDVPDPYNLYFTPDGRIAIIVQELLKKIEFRDAHTWAVIRTLPVSINGIDHLDFSADGSYFLLTTEYSGTVVKVDMQKMEIAGLIQVGGLPIDVRLSPDGTVFFVANQGKHGVSVVDPVAMKEIGFIPTGRGAHGFALSRDTRSLYVSNRADGSLSVIDIAARKVTATWKIGGYPDMIQVNPAGNQIWVSSRFDGNVIVVDATSGAVTNRIHCCHQAHGLTYFPAPGSISLGHNGVYR